MREKCRSALRLLAIGRAFGARVLCFVSVEFGGFGRRAQPSARPNALPTTSWGSHSTRRMRVLEFQTGFLFLLLGGLGLSWLDGNCACGRVERVGGDLVTVHRLTLGAQRTQAFVAESGDEQAGRFPPELGDESGVA
jgi:hypothetical protein